MKRYLFCFVISMITINVNAQTKINYTYDEMGNLIKRSDESNLKSRSRQKDVEDLKNVSSDNEVSIIEESPSGKYIIKLRDFVDDNQATVRIYSESGAIVLNKKFGGSGTNIDISNQADGIYIMQINISNNYSSQWKLPKSGAGK